MPLLAQQFFRGSGFTSQKIFSRNSPPKILLSDPEVRNARPFDKLGGEVRDFLLVPFNISSFFFFLSSCVKLRCPRSMWFTLLPPLFSTSQLTRPALSMQHSVSSLTTICALLIQLRIPIFVSVRLTLWAKSGAAMALVFALLFVTYVTRPSSERRTFRSTSGFIPESVRLLARSAAGASRSCRASRTTSERTLERDRFLARFAVKVLRKRRLYMPTSGAIISNAL